MVENVGVLSADRLVAMRCLLLDSRAAHAINALESAGLQVILLKGRVTTVWLYDDGIRSYGDIDLLIDPVHRQQVVDVLASIGYVHWMAGADEVEYGPNELDLVGPGHICIDLHHTLLGVAGPPEQCWRVLSTRTEQMTVGGRVVTVLDAAARTMHLALHAAQNGPVDGKATADLELGLARLPSELWRKALVVARDLGAVEAFSAGLYVVPAGRLMAVGLGLEPPSGLELILRTRSAPSEAIQIQRFVETESSVARARMVARKLWPTAAYMRRRFRANHGLELLFARLRRMIGLPMKLGIALSSWNQARLSAHRTAERRLSDLRGFVLVAGPDGAGKSTVVERLTARVASGGGRVVRAHHRPGLLAGRRGDAAPVTDPHAEPPRSPGGSLAKLALVFADHQLGGMTTWWIARRRGLLLLERGWFDMLVDPRRYRLPIRFAPLVSALGRLLTTPDVVVLLTGEPTRLHGRKPEIGVTEVARQVSHWRTVAPRAGRQVIEIDTTETSPDVAVVAIVEALAEPIWYRAPLTPPRISLRSTGRAELALAVYQPQSGVARAGSRVRKATRIRGPRTGAPVPGLAGLWRTIGVVPDGVAALHSSTRGRWVLSACRGGRVELIAKVGPSYDAALRHEAVMLGAPWNTGVPLRRPELVWCGDWMDRFVVVTKAVQRSSDTPWSVDEIVPLVRGLSKAGVGGDALTHGDLAPWNLVRTVDGPVLLDWESARWTDEPLHDLAHFVVQVGALLGRHCPEQAVSLLTDDGSPGSLLLSSRGCDVASARPLLAAFLQEFRPSEPRAERFGAKMKRLVEMRDQSLPLSSDFRVASPLSSMWATDDS